MNIALFALRPTNFAPIIADLNPTIILTSGHMTLSKRLAEAAIQLDELIHFNNTKIDLVCVINEPNLSLSNINNFSHDDYVDRVCYTTDNIYTSSFYCKPHVFSLLSNLYKINLSQNDFRNFEDGSVEQLTEKIFYLVNRLGIEFKIG